MKRLILSLLSVTALASLAHAGERIQLTQPDSLICRYQTDLQTFMLLNQGKSKAAVRAFYQVIASQGRLVSAQPGLVVEALQYFTDGTVEVGFNGRTGFIAQADLH